MCAANETIKLSKKDTCKLIDGTTDKKCGVILRANGVEYGAKDCYEILEIVVRQVNVRIRRGTVDHFAE